MSDLWLQLQKEFGLLNLLVVIVVGLLRIVFDGVVELLGEILIPSFFELPEPSFDVFHPFVNNHL